MKKIILFVFVVLVISQAPAAIAVERYTFITKDSYITPEHIGPPVVVDRSNYVVSEDVTIRQDGSIIFKANAIGFSENFHPVFYGEKTFLLINGTAVINIPEKDKGRYHPVFAVTGLRLLYPLTEEGIKAIAKRCMTEYE